MPFKVDLDRCPIAVGDDVYHYVDDHDPVQAMADAADAINPEFTSLISATLTVPASVKTLAELLAAVETTETDEALATADIAVLSYSGTVDPHPAMNIVADTFDITATLTTAGAITIVDDGAGGLADVGANVSGTIDYVTGAWAITVAGDTFVDSSAITVTYDWKYVVPTATPAQSLWMSPGAADAIYATYSEDGVPTASTGILISEAVYLASQPTMIANAKFIGSDTALDVEVMI